MSLKQLIVRLIMIPALIAGGVGLVGSLANTIAGSQVAQQNLDLQGATLDYQKKMQQLAWAREDNAVQRRVADLKAAGLNPVLAAGSGASSSAPISVTTPRKEYVPLDINALGMMSQVQQIAQSKAQQALTEIEAKKQRWNLDYYMRNDIPTDADPMMKKIAQFLEVVFGKGAMGQVSNINANVEKFTDEANKKVPFLKWLDELTGLKQKKK